MMRKKWTLCAVLIAAVLLTVTAAGAADFTGYWRSTGVDMGDGKITDVFDMDAIKVPAKYLIYLQIKPNGTAEIVSFGEKNDQGTWKADGDTLEMKGLDDDQGVSKLTMKDGKLRLEADMGMLLYLEKQKGELDVDAALKESNEAIGEEVKK